MAANAALIALHLAYAGWHSAEALKSSPFSVAMDRGYGEVLMYLQAFWAALLLGALAVRRREAGWMAWAVLFFYLLADDALKLHETGGGWLAGRLDLPSVAGLRPKDLGEVMVTGAAAAGIGVALAVGYWRGGAALRGVSHRLLAGVALLGVLGVGVDTLHALVGGHEPLNFAFTLVEDGGEMVVMSLLAALVFGAWLRLGGKTRAGLRRPDR